MGFHSVPRLLFCLLFLSLSLPQLVSSVEGAKAPSPAPGSPNISYPTSIPLQFNVTLQSYSGLTWRGWGTSLSWFAVFIGGLPQGQLKKILDLLFDKDTGLGLDIVRYILPGGANPARFAHPDAFPFRLVPGFRPIQGGAYDWSADANQRAVLTGAIERGAIAEAVVYSPPWYQTISGDVTGRVGSQQNLDPSNFQDFAGYVADVLAHFKEAWGVEFMGLDPFNEPLSPWWKGHGNQEGCSFAGSSLSSVLDSMRVALAKKGLNATGLVGIDEWVSRTRSAFIQYPTLWNQVSRVALHGYRVPTQVLSPKADQLDQFLSLSQMAAARRKDLWVVEWGPWKPTPANPGDLDLALVQARHIMELVNIGGASAFVHWQAITPTQGPNYSPQAGMIRMPFKYKTQPKPVLTKQYYVQLHFSRFVRPGSRILPLPRNAQRFAFAAYDASLRQLSFFALNKGRMPHFPYRQD